MKITGIRTEAGSFGTRFAATVAWEDSARPPVEIWWDIPDELAADARPDPNAFLAAAFVPAFRHGEGRIAIEGTVCPLLGRGLHGIAQLLGSWWPGRAPAPVVEPAEGWSAAIPPSRPAAAGYLTGGVDSLHLLFSNLEDFPADHPERFSHALWIRGLDYPGAEEGDWARSQYARLEPVLSDLASSAGVRLAPVTTNLRRLEPDLSFLAYEYLAAALLSGAHLLTRKFSTVAVASSFPAERLPRWGTHPLIDRRLGSGGLFVRHAALGIGRIEKLARLRGRTDVLARLISCSNAPAGETLNCGHCTKCVRTLLEMEASGTLADARSFPAGEVTAATIAPLEIDGPTDYFWGRIVAPLRAAGREEVAAAIERKIRETIRHRRRVEGLDWTGAIRRFDRNVLGGRIKKTYRRISG